MALSFPSLGSGPPYGGSSSAEPSSGQVRRSRIRLRLFQGQVPDPRTFVLCQLSQVLVCRFRAYPKNRLSLGPWPSIF